MRRTGWRRWLAPSAGYAAAVTLALFIAFPNFYVINRYNKSRLYAAAVTSLAEALRAAYTGAPATTVGMR